MKVLRVDPNAPNPTAIQLAADILLEEGIIIYPTDTVYGIGSILKEEPIKRIFAAKGRDFNSPLSVAFSDAEEVRHYAEVSAEQMALIGMEHRDGMTFILERKNTIPDYVTAGLPTVGARIPDSEICRQLIRKTGPIITTSANPTGKPAPTSIKELDEEIGNKADLVVDGGPTRHGKPSKIIDLTKDDRILRE